MISMLAASLVAFASPALLSAGETWETLSREYEQAFEAWVAGRQGLAPGAETGEWDAAPFRPRFLALAEEGEGRAVLWLLANRGNEHASRVIDLVERAEEAPWVGSAYHVLATGPTFEATRLVALLEKRIASGRDPAARAQAAFARARALDASDQARATELRLWGAMLQCQGVDLAPGETLAQEDMEELAAKVLDVLEAASNDYFELAYYPGAGGTYFPRAGAPPDPEEVWRPVIEVLAQRDVRRAQYWALSNAPWQVDEPAKQRLTSYLDALTSAPLEPEELQGFGYQIDSLVYRLGIDAVEPRMRRLIDQSPEQDRAGLLFGLGDALCGAAGDDAALRERGLACLREVEERWPASEQASSAKGRLFRYTKLLVGMPCPDFETVDADGTPFKLSDYRGKVTVIGFWGFW
jgi:hypothetical protein